VGSNIFKYGDALDKMTRLFEINAQAFRGIDDTGAKGVPVDDSEIIRLVNEAVKQSGLFLPPDAKITWVEPLVTPDFLGGMEVRKGHYDIEDISIQLQELSGGSTTISTQERINESPTEPPSVEPNFLTPQTLTPQDVVEPTSFALKA